MSLFQDILTYLSPLVLLIGSIVGFIYLKRLNFMAKCIVLYLITSFLIDIISRIALHFYGNNLIILPIYSAIELVIISAIYWHLSMNKFIVLLLVTPAIIYTIAELIYLDAFEVDSFQSYTKIVSSFVLVILSFRYFLVNLMHELTIPREVQQLNFMVLFYFALNLIVLLPLNLLINQIGTSIVYIWYAYLGATIVFYSYLAFFLWRSGRILKQ